MTTYQGKDDIQKKVLSRLKKIEGQVRGIQKMIEENRSCADIAVQISAVRAALSGVGQSVLACEISEMMMIGSEGNSEKFFPDIVEKLKRFN